ncbi:MAG TPA: hypothetical protein PKZ07_14480 [Sedimentisphaerales bacterium]|nr:hypothetical protein [Sedimentisphaerales bacterium]
MKNATVINSKIPERKQLPPFPFLLIEIKTKRVWITKSMGPKEGGGMVFTISPIGEDSDRNRFEDSQSLLSDPCDFRLPEPGEKIVIEY